MSPVHDYVIDNSTGANVRSDINSVLQAILSNNSSSSAPSTTAAYMFWADTTSGTLKIRNSANDGWVELLQLDGTLTIEDGSASAAGLGFRTDLDTGLFLDAAGELGITAGGTKRMTVTATKGILINTDTEGSVSADNLTIADTGNAGITIRSGNTSSGNIFFSDATSGNAEFAGYLQYNHSTNFLFLGANESNAIVIDASTASDIRVGIGIATPANLNGSADDLVIENADHCGITIKSPTNKTGNIFFADGTSGNAEFEGFVQYNHDQDKMYIGAVHANQIEISDGVVEISDANLLIGTAGHGIDFSNASGSASGSQNALLNDYEEGTFTPSFTQGVTGGSYTTQTGHYTKVGRLVMISCRIDGNGLSATSDNLLLGGLPFTTVSSGGTAGGLYFAYSDNFYSGSSGTNLALTIIVNNNATVCEFFDGDGTQKNGTDFYDVNRNIHIVGTYHAA
mgnify:CR=1 FL=1|tara:strand:+ start:292 stop:1656 length:1365 start_codon:yes stop_codon:yes gene_type:complete